MRTPRRPPSFFVEAALRHILGSAPVTRLLELVSREEAGSAAAGMRQEAGPVPDVGYHPLALSPTSDAVPQAAPRGIRAWEVTWKFSREPGRNGLGYAPRAAFHLPQAEVDRRPGVIVLPLLHQRIGFASGMLARYLASRGLAVLELRSGAPFLEIVRVTPEGSEPTWEDVAEEMLLDGRHALDWLCARPEVDPGRLGIVGISYGAMVGSCLLGADPRIRAGVLFMGAGDQALIVGRSRERSVRRFRRRLLKAHGLSDSRDLRRFETERTFLTEPLSYAPAVSPDRVLLFKTRLDRMVVPEAQDKLWEALGRPRRIVLPCGHLGFGLAFYYAARRAADFLWERLSEPLEARG